MKAYLLRRLLLMIPTFIGISLITFAVVQLAPGNPILLKFRPGTTDRSVPAKVIEDTKKLYGLDKPLYVQYARWMGRLVLLDFGRSYKDLRPVRDKILETLPITLQLNILSILAVYLISIPVGVYSATRPRSLTDKATTVFLFILYSMPSFWVAMLLMLFFGGGRYLSWFPVYGVSSDGAAQLALWPWLLDRAWHLVLPVFCLSYAGLAAMSRFMRAGLIDVIQQDYIRTARAYGISERVAIYKYAMRNALIPMITVLGAMLPTLIGGSVIIESIFSIPGMGRLSFEAILSRDYPLIMGILSISAILTLLGLLLSDFLYALVDPRIKFE